MVVIFLIFVSLLAVSPPVAAQSSGTVTPNQDFRNRAGAPGVIVAQGFDDPSVFVPMYQYTPGGTGTYPDGTGEYTKIVRDTTTFVSGGGALRYEIDPYTGANCAGEFRQMFSSSPSGAMPANVHCFGPDPGCSPTFYVQYRFRITPEMVNQDWGDHTGHTGWKFSIFHWSSKTCASVELTATNYYSHINPIMYTDCGGRGIFTTYWPALTWTGSTPFLLQQGDSPTSGYNCPYGTNISSNTGCFKFSTNSWMTFYWKITVGAWNTPTSSIQSWVSPGPGVPLKEWINEPNMSLNYDTLGNDYNSVELLNYMTGKDPTLNHPVAFTWYDELIISTQPIAAPADTGHTAPTVINNVEAVSLTQASAVITWTTDKGATSQVEYGFTASYGSSTVIDNSYLVSHRVNLTGLAANTTYHYHVISQDIASNLTAGADATFTTLAEGVISPPDTTPPATTGVKIFPNPYDSTQPGGMIFEGEGGLKEARIYTLGGKHVRTVAASNGNITWDGRNDSGEKVSKGIYLGVITQSNGDKITIKIGVIK